MDSSPPGSSVHGISQARILEGQPFPSPGALPDPGTEPASPALQASSLQLSCKGSRLTGKGLILGKTEAKGKGQQRWDGQAASLTRWARIWANAGESAGQRLLAHSSPSGCKRPGITEQQHRIPSACLSCSWKRVPCDHPHSVPSCPTPAFGDHRSDLSEFAAFEV